MRPLSTLLGLALLTAACQGEPTHVYIPASPPVIELGVRASSAEVVVGEPVILFAERTTRGEWTRVRRDSLPEGQCWMAEPPAAKESEVADNLRWIATPADSARFNTEYRQDHTREVWFLAAGRYTIDSESAPWCGGTAAKGERLTIVVSLR